MSNRPVKLLLLLALTLSCLTFTIASAQTQLAQWGSQPSPEEREREQGERHDEEWQKHHQRYFGGTVIQPGPAENRENYRTRVHAQCNVQWDQCARNCNTIGNAYQREACVANCNNELNECKASF